MMTIENNGHCCAYCMRIRRMPVVLAVDLLVQSSNRVRFAGSVSCFTSIVIDRARSSSPGGAIMPAIDRKCFDFQQTTSHGVLLRVCMQVNETGHAQRLNM